jgi:AraC-like DNA-binding protein
MNWRSAIQSLPDRGDPPPVPQHDRPIEVKMPSHGVYVFESHHTTTFRADSRAHDFLEPGDLDHAAFELGMSRRRFTQLFREVAGTSWSDFVRAQRIDHACRLLAQTRRSIEAIALDCGYKNLPSFYRAFKGRTHMTPHQWRLLPATAPRVIAWSVNPHCPTR